MLKKVLSIIGVIVLGALGSGLWELSKPLLSWGLSALLTLATLGMETLKNGMYAQAASASTRPTGLGLAVFDISSIVLMTGFIIIRYIQHTFRPQSNRISSFYIALLFMGATFMFVASTRTFYVTQLAEYNAKLEVIASPYLTDMQLKQLRAQYLQVTDKPSYLKHINMLKKIIKDAGESTPDREFF